LPLSFFVKIFPKKYFNVKSTVTLTLHAHTWSLEIQDKYGHEAVKEGGTNK
jgi:hypothetical protein